MEYDYPPEEDYEEPRVLWGRVGVYAGSLLLAFILGSCLGGGTGDLEDQLEAAQSEATQANQRAETAERQLDELSQRLATDEGDSAEDEGEGEADADGDGATGTVADDDGDTDTADGERQHTVSEGETLTTIAQRFYGDPTAWPTIAEANDIEGTDLRIGDVLIIPPPPDE